MKVLMQVRRLRLVPHRRHARLRLRPGDQLQVVKIRPPRERSGRRLPERVLVQVVQAVGSEFDQIAAEHP